MKKDNRICYTCGKAYHYCFSCPDDPRPRWTFMFCCEECRDIFVTLTDYESGHLIAEEAYNKLREYKLDDEKIGSYDATVQASFKKLNEELKKSSLVDSSTKNNVKK